MARGGPRRPQAPQPPSGPGPFSRRTDANQPVRVPGLDSPDMQYGDVGQLQQAQRMNPLPRPGGGPNAAPPPPPPPRLGGEPTQPGGIPPVLLGAADQSTRPGEPTTAGLDQGAGPGSEILQSQGQEPDVRELVLEYLAANYNNYDAANMLQQLREERAAPAQAPAAAAGGPTGLEAPAAPAPGPLPPPGAEPPSPELPGPAQAPPEASLQPSPQVAEAPPPAPASA